MKLIKGLMPLIGLSSIIVPLSTMTSCARSWGNLSAFSIGGTTVQKGPYADIAETDFDYDGVSYKSYLQSNYSIKQNSNTVYAYSSPMKWDSDNHKWVNGDSGWYSNGSPVFNSTASYKDGDEEKTSTNAQNATLSSNISFINSIGLTINNYLSSALAYQSSQIAVAEENKESIKTAWGSGSASHPFNINFGASGSQQIKDFFENVYAIANLNGSGRSSAMLRTSNVSFKFNGINPLPSYKFIENPKTRNGFSDTFFKYLEGTSPRPEGYTINDFKYYSSKSDVQNEGEKDEHYNFQYNNVPIRIKFESLTQTYLNPQRADSFLVNDYYSTSEQVAATIGDQWKRTMPQITGCHIEEAIPHYKTFSWNTSANQIDFSISPKDTRLQNASGNDFIALINYNLSVYTRDGKYKDDKATINGVSNLFPACWLDIFKNREDWYSETRKDSSLYALNSNTVSNIASHFNELLKRTNGIMAKDLSQNDKEYLTFLGYMFGTNGTNEIVSTNILQPKDNI